VPGSVEVTAQPEVPAAADRLFETAFILVISANLANSLGANSFTKPNIECHP